MHVGIGRNIKIEIRMLQEIKLAAYKKQYGEHWADELPENCPPEEVCIANNDVFYRLIHHTDHTTPEDWQNTITEQPKRKFTPEQIIYAAGMSVLNTEEVARDKLKMPFMKNKGLIGVAKISLIPEDGVVLQTFYESHYTWWRTTLCNLEKAELI